MRGVNCFVIIKYGLFDAWDVDMSLCCNDYYCLLRLIYIKMIPKMKWTKEEELEKLLNDINSKMKQEFDTLSKESSN